MIVYPGIGGNWFQWRGVPAGQESELAVGPEDAVRVAAQLTGRRVTTVPDLVIPDAKDGLVADARWRIQLDSSVTMVTRASHQSLTVANVYVQRSKRSGQVSVDVETATTDRDQVFQYRTALPKGPGDFSVPMAIGVAKRRAEFPAQYQVVAEGDDLTLTRSPPCAPNGMVFLCSSQSCPVCAAPPTTRTRFTDTT